MVMSVRSRYWSSCWRVLVTIAITFAGLCQSLPALAAAAATVNRNPVAMNESFALILRSDRGGDPNLAPLQKDFEVVGQSSSNNIQYINGSVTRSMQWTISLMAKRTGVLTIPAIAVGGENTQPITLEVRDAPAASKSQEKGNLFIEVSAEPSEAYVQQQILLIVRLFYAVEIVRGSQLSDPKFEKMGPTVQRMDEDHQYQTTRNGREYSVIERHYALFAPQSGTFVDGSVTFDGSVIDSGTGSEAYSLSPYGSTHRLRVKSNALTFTIKPIPPGVDEARWLPASRLEIKEQWSDNPPKFVVGEPVTRTLTIRATGVVSAQLPVLDGGTHDEFKVYPDQPVLHDEASATALQASREQKIAMIPTTSGTMTLPAIEIQWWNTRDNKLEVARLPEREVIVRPGVGSSASHAADATSNNLVTTKVTPTPAISSGRYESMWPWLTALCALGWASTTLWWWRSRAKKKTDHEQAARTESIESLRRLRHHIKANCDANDAEAVKPLLLSWAVQRWHDKSINSLTAVARRCNSELAKSLLELDRMLYSSDSSAWNGKSLWSAFERAESTSKVASPASKASLKMLYESDLT